VAVCAHSNRSDGHVPAGAEPVPKLTLQLDHSMGAGQRSRADPEACNSEYREYTHGLFSLQRDRYRSKPASVSPERSSSLPFVGIAPPHTTISSRHRMAAASCMTAYNGVAPPITDSPGSDFSTACSAFVPPAKRLLGRFRGPGGVADGAQPIDPFSPGCCEMHPILMLRY